MSVKLTENDKRVLVAVQLLQDTSLSKVASELKLQEKTIRRSLDKMIEQQVLTPYCLVDSYRLGYLEFEFFCTLIFKSADSRKRFISSVISSKKISWLVELGGEFQFAFGVWAKSAYEASQTLNSIVNEHSAKFQKREMMIDLGWMSFARKYLANVPFTRAKLVLGFTSDLVEISELDRKILSELVKAPFAPQRELAKSIGVPTTTLNYHLQILKSKNVFKGAIYSLSARLFGAYVFRIMVEISNPLPEVRDKITAFCYIHPNVTSVLEGIGRWDYAIRIEALDPDEPYRFQNDFISSFGQYVSSLTMMPIFKDHKYECIPAWV